MIIPQVSIQIPTYNQASILKRAITSALRQDYKNFEVIISDDCSTDNTEEVVANFKDSRIKYFKNEKNLGRVGNYKNALYNYSLGDWVVNLDGDDYFTDDSFISDGINAILKNKDTVLYMAQNCFLKKIAKINNITINNSYIVLNGLQYLENYSMYPSFFHLASLYNRKLALQKGFYIINCLTADFVSVMKLADKGNFVISNKIVGKWDVNENSASKTLTAYSNINNIQGLKCLVDSLNFYSVKQKYKVWKELEYVNKYYLISAIANKKEFRKSLFAFLKLLTFKKRYYWKGLLKFLVTSND